MRAELKVVWRNADAIIERDALAFWRQNDLLHKDHDARERLGDLCVVAYEGGRMVGTLEASLRQVELVKSRLAVIRISSPRHNVRQLRMFPARMVLRGQKVLEDWARRHPEEGVMGVMGIVAPGTYNKMHRPIWQPFGFVLVNYTRNREQVRLAWFGHAAVA